MSAAAILKIQKHHILAAIRAISMKFGKLMQFNPLDRSDRWKIETLKIQDGGGRHLEKYKDHHISAVVQAMFMKFGPMTHYMYIICTKHNF